MFCLKCDEDCFWLVTIPFLADLVDSESVFDSGRILKTVHLIGLEALLKIGDYGL